MTISGLPLVVIIDIWNLFFIFYEASCVFLEAADGLDFQ